MIKEIADSNKIACMIVYDEDKSELSIVRQNISTEQVQYFLETLVLPAIKGDPRYSPNVAKATTPSGNIYNPNVNVN